jgi:hypothetical protein
MIISAPCIAQQNTQRPESSAMLLGAGINWNQYASPQLSGNIFFAQKIAENNGFPTYSFNLLDVVSKTKNPFTVAVSITPGLAQQVFKFNGMGYFVLGTVGVSAGGTDAGKEGIVGFSWSTGGAVSIPYKKVIFIPMFRALKTSTSADFQAVYGLNIAFVGK